ncbi:MAG TPA: hypothetical protein VEK08_09545 [Planctomycetota bacterium]|nr:hypothetical protein [Planctomycetota bacterium]
MMRFIFAFLFIAVFSVFAGEAAIDPKQLELGYSTPNGEFVTSLNSSVSIPQITLDPIKPQDIQFEGQGGTLDLRPHR